MLNLAVGTISNYSDNIFLLKATSSILLIGAAVLNFILCCKKGAKEPVNCHSERSEESQADQCGDSSLNYVPFRMTNSNNHFTTGLKKLLIFLLLIVFYLSLTLSYSSNPAYGFQKILNFLISVVPSVLVFYYLISTLT